MSGSYRSPGDSHRHGEPTAESAAGLSVCMQCDVAVEVVPPRKGEVSLCPVCRGPMARHHRHPFLLSLQFTLAALVPFAIVLAYPFLTLSVAGLRETSTVAETATTLWREGFPLLGALVLLMTLALPLLRLLSLVYVLLPLTWGARAPSAWLVFRMVETVAPWSMLDVFLIGVLVAVVKLVDLAAVSPGIGLYAFVALMLLAVAASTTLDREFVWEHIRRDRTV
jgi:paraquat-inducible protein A